MDNKIVLLFFKNYFKNKDSKNMSDKSFRTVGQINKNIIKFII